MNKKVKIQVLLSTYNGEKYIEEQIDSIMGQDNIEMEVLVRDDGSSDRTVTILDKLEKKYGIRLKYYVGNNIGYKKSFLELINTCNLEADYFAFSDQDDVWKPKKMERAIKLISKENGEYIVYGSNVLITDEKLNIIKKTDISNFKKTFGSVLNRTRIAGCTMVFSKNIINLVRKIYEPDIPNDKMYSHDGLILALCTAIGGNVITDNESKEILHRRHSNAATSGGMGIKHRIRVEYNRVFKTKGDKKYLTQQIYNKLNSYMTSENKKLAYEVIHYEDSIKNTILLAKDKRLSCGIGLCDLENKMKIVLRKF